MGPFFLPSQFSHASRSKHHKNGRYPLLLSVQKIDQYSIKSCCLQMPIWREEEVREVSSHVTCHATLVSFQPKERSCAEAEAKKEVHSLLSLGGINAQKVGHLASEIGVGIPKKSNEIFCGSSKRLGSGAGKMLLLRLKPFFFAFLCPIIIWWQQKQSALAGCCFLEAFQSSEAPLSFCLGIFELQTRKKKQPLLLLMRNLARLLLFPTYNDFRFQNQQQPEDNPYSQPNFSPNLLAFTPALAGAKKYPWHQPNSSMQNCRIYFKI